MSMMLEVWTPTALIIAVIGGGLTGWLLGSFVPPNPDMPRHRTLTGFAIIGGIGFVFYLGQVIDALGNGDAFWPRIVARGAMFLLFTASLAIAGTIVQDRKQRR